MMMMMMIMMMMAGTDGVDGKAGARGKRGKRGKGLKGDTVSTVQYSTVQYSTVQGEWSRSGLCNLLWNVVPTLQTLLFAASVYILSFCLGLEFLHRHHPLAILLYFCRPHIFKVFKHKSLFCTAKARRWLWRLVVSRFIAAVSRLCLYRCMNIICGSCSEQ